MTAPHATRLVAREAEVGGMVLRRALPTRGKRLVGAWCFLDHIGPADIRDTAGLRVGPHPHMGLQTFTWMIDGEILHRDSLGSVQPIRPGQVNLMTAGRGISHSEESPNPHPARVHAAQLWIALPERVRHCEPAFDHYPVLPVSERDGFRRTLLVGELDGERSPVRVHTPLFGLDVAAAGGASTNIGLREDFEYGVVVLEGSALVAGEALLPGSLLDLGLGRSSLSLQSEARARVLVLGGAPLDETPLLFWNFVARTPAEIAEAVRQWNTGDPRFGEVRGFDGPRMPSPQPPVGLRAPT